jgi:hypothetical protein
MDDNHFARMVSLVRSFRMGYRKLQKFINKNSPPDIFPCVPGQRGVADPYPSDKPAALTGNFGIATKRHGGID